MVKPVFIAHERDKTAGFGAPQRMKQSENVMDSLLHVGYMKTATTFLQGAVFNNEQAGFGIPLGGKGRAFIVEKIILSDGYSFDAAAVKIALDDASKEVRSRGLIPVWSDETLLGEPVSRRYDGYSNALRLKAAVPKAKVLITIREQKALAYSMYAEYLRQGGLASLTQFIGNGQETTSFSPILNPNFLLYDRSVALYHELFGADNVLVLPQELLLQQPQAYYDCLGNFLGLPLTIDLLGRQPTHVSYNATATVLSRLLNRVRSPHPLTNIPSQSDKVVHKTLRIVTKVMPKVLDAWIKNKMARKIRERFDGIFAESNRRLEELTGLDLLGMGYE